VTLIASDRWVTAVGCATVGLALASLAAALAPHGWPFELFAHFRWQLAAATALTIPVVVLTRRAGLMAIAAVALAGQSWPLFDRMVQPAESAPPAAPCHGPRLRVASINLWVGNEDPRRVLDWLASHPADVVLLQEVTPAWRDALDATRDDYPNRLMVPRPDPYGIGILSRLPLAHVRTVDFAGDGLPSLLATTRVESTEVDVIGLHTHWPVLPGLQRARDRALREVAQQARRSRVPTILAGDLNLTPYAPGFDRLLDGSGLRDAFAGKAWRPTWQAGLWPLAIPIDHVLIPGDACVIEASIGPDVGSDHRPVQVTLKLR
jgi:endonuclease/exonuclease/phosphatase (EEP) superfamily protein YafD